MKSRALNFQTWVACLIFLRRIYVFLLSAEWSFSLKGSCLAALNKWFWLFSSSSYAVCSCLAFIYFPEISKKWLTRPWRFAIAFRGNSTIRSPWQSPRIWWSRTAFMQKKYSKRNKWILLFCGRTPKATNSLSCRPRTMPSTFWFVAKIVRNLVWAMVRSWMSWSQWETRL